MESPANDAPFSPLSGQFADKLTKKGKELASVVDNMAELQEWLKTNHPETKPEDK